jgi:putative ABC transport system permease protein
MCAAVILSQLAIPFFNDAFNTSIPYIDGSLSVWLFFGVMLLIISLMSGGYPAFMLSSFKPIRVLRGEIKGNFQYLIVRKALVVFQFAISALMITATFFIGKQLRYMSEKDLGFTPEHVVKIRINNPVVGQNSKSLRDQLLSEKFSISASYISGHPGGFYDASTVRVQGTDENIRMRTLYSDENLLSTLDLKMAAGRFFSARTPSDSSSAVVLNETAVRQLGWTPEEALGRRVSLSQFDSTYKEVVGVIADYHFTSLKEVIEPLIISYRDDSGNLLVKIAGSSTQEAVATIEQIWNSYESGFPIEMSFMDDVIGELYHQEANQGRMFRIFSGISVVIACIGILGLSTYIAVQRKKEIGIRKVLGASVSQLSFLLAKDLAQLVFIANVLMIPIAYLILEQWAQSFAYRAPFDPFLFLWAALAVTAVALMIVTLNSARAAHEDPVRSLRPE